ncbi:MAG: DNA mismatch repair protein MutS [Sphingomonadales bacterium]|nr:MAG: DNA mismatch repair protein MutS [Sphingomonadales bacterium]
MRRLAPEEAALWQLVIATVKPIAGRKAVPKAAMAPAAAAPPPGAKPAPRKMKPAPPPAPPPPRSVAKAANTLDGSWDRQLSRGLVSPESAIDLHGHSLASAYDRLDRGLEQAIAQGDRVLLLVTGKPPRAESERPHARGAIRAAVGDWLASSRHAGRIAAVRNAHPRHGGSGALYIVLRRPILNNTGKKS